MPTSIYKKYRLSYIIALAFIAIITITSHVLIGRILETNKGFSYLINVSGRQRMYSQRITAFALQYYLGDIKKLKEMQQTAAHFNRSFEELSNPFQLIPNDASEYQKTMQSIYFTGPYALKFDIDRLNVLIDQLTTYANTPKRYKVALNKLLELTNYQIIERLDDAVYEYQIESERRIQYLDGVQKILLILILCALLIEALFIFKPMIDRLIQAASQLLKLATIDELSGLYNRRAFNEFINERFNLAKRYERVCSMVTIDIDSFKKINDTYGHVAGDEVIKYVAGMIKKNLRSSDKAFRLGGEEFGIVLPETTAAESLKVVDRIRKQIRDTSVPYNGHNIQLTVSAGIAEMNKHNTAHVVEHSDKALYHAKMNGKNQTVIFDNI